MADVVGNIGSESVRLRGMAMEITQQAMLDEIRDLVKVLDKDGTVAKNHVSALDSIANTIERTNTNSKRRDKVSADGIREFKKKLDAAGEKLGSVIDNRLIQTIRGWDANIATSSYALNRMAGASRGFTSTIMKFGADTVDQLQEQFETYKKLTVIGGATADDFDSLRTSAAQLGLTMTEYTSLITENFQTLRAGGSSIRRVMKDISERAVEFRNNTDGIADQFATLGVGARDYMRVMMQTTGIMGGYAKAREKYGSGLDVAMLNMTKRSQELSEAFGFNRDQMMEGAKKMMEKARTANLFEALKNEIGPQAAAGFDEALQYFKQFTGGDEQKAQSLILAAYGRVVDEFAGNMMATNKDFIPAVAETMRNLINGVPKDRAFSTIEKVFEEVDRKIGKDFGTNYILGLSPLAEASDLLQQGARNYRKARDRMTDTDLKTNDKSRDLLKGYSALERANIDLAVQMTAINKVFNELGIGIANVFTLLSMSATAYGNDFVNTYRKSELRQEIDKLIKDIKGGANNITDVFTPKGQEEIRRRMIESGGGEDQPPRPSPQQAPPPVINNGMLPAPVMTGVLPTSVDPNASVIFGTGRGTRTTAGSAGTGEGRPAHNAALNNFLTMMAANPNLGGSSLQVTSMARPGSTGKHGQGLAMDLAIAGLGAEGYRQFHSRILSMAKATGMNVSETFEGIGSDTDMAVVNEGSGYKSPHWTGNHVHLQFQSPGAAEKFRTWYSNQYGRSTQGGAAGNVQPLASNGSQNNAGASLAQVAIGPEGGDTSGGSVNTVSYSGNGMVNTSNGVVIVSLTAESADELASAIMAKLTPIKDNLENAAYYLEKQGFA